MQIGNLLKLDDFMETQQEVKVYIEEVMFSFKMSC